MHRGGDRGALNATLLHFLTIPLFTGVIGYVTNWTGLIMLFQPIRFRGFRIPGLQPLVGVLPRKLQQIPGVMQGGVGWQGIIPSRAAKMGSIAVDKGIAKLGSPSEFVRQLEPERMAEHILATVRPEMRETVERIVQREHPDLWRDLPPQVRQRIHERVQEQLPEMVHSVTDELAHNVDHLLDIKLMVIRRMEANPELANKVYTEVGGRELRLMVNFGFLFGFLLGFPVAAIDQLVEGWWILPILGVLVGYVTNVVAIWMIFEPVEPRRILGLFTFQGLFLRRQREAGEVYARIIAGEIVTLKNIGEELLGGPQSDRTRQMIEDAMRPAVDRSVGPLRPAVRVAVGRREYDAIRESVATEAVEYTMTPLVDDDFNREQSEKVHELVSERIREMPPRDFSEMLRSAMREDEWLLYLHGAVLGFGGGLAHLAVFGV
ncbi:MAG TPA: hypothetical protein VF520_15640 [Thermoleophilaceae bacterium]|jgi:uncharacterized membrane protein YheB (UPF0754 family)